MTTSARLERVLFGQILRDDDLGTLRAVVQALAAGFGLVALAWVGAVLWMREAPLRALVLLGVSLLFGGGFALARRGSVASGALLVQLVLFAMITAGALFGGGIYSPVLGHYAIAIISGGLFFGARGGYATAGLAALATLAVAMGAQPLMFEGPLAVQGAHVLVAVHVAFFAVVAGLVALGARWLSAALAGERRSAAELRERNQQLETSRERFRQLAEQANDMVSEHTPDGRLLYVSPSILRFTGKTWDHLVGREHIGAVHPDDQATLQDLLPEVQRQGGTREPVLFRSRRADGAWRWTEAVTSGFATPSGERRMVTIARDVTPRIEAQRELERRVAERTRELEEALAALRREAEQRERAREELRRAERLAAIGTLAAGLAHEINNPVGSILAAAEYARSRHGEVDGRADVGAHLAKIETEALRCQHIVKGVLTFAREAAAPKRIADLNDVLRRARTPLAEPLRRRGGELELELGAGLAPFALNPTELEQALGNLVRNAAESGATRVRIRTEASSEGVRVRVADDGKGIAPELCPRIFDPFFTTRHAEGGVGLGLSIVHGIVTGHGGSIRVESGPAGGAEFVLDFPVGEVPA